MENNINEKPIWKVEDLNITDTILFAIFHILFIIAVSIISAILLKRYGLKIIFYTIDVYKNYTMYNIGIFVSSSILSTLVIYIHFKLYNCIFIWCRKIHNLILCRIKKYTNLIDGTIIFDDVALKGLLVSEGAILRDETKDE